MRRRRRICIWMPAREQMVGARQRASSASGCCPCGAPALEWPVGARLRASAAGCPRGAPARERPVGAGLRASSAARSQRGVATSAAVGGARMREAAAATRQRLLAGENTPSQADELSQTKNNVNLSFGSFGCLSMYGLLQILNYPSLMPLLICAMHNLRMHVGRETDEICADLKLQTLDLHPPSQELMANDLHANGSHNPNVLQMFCKGYSTTTRRAELHGSGWVGSLQPIYQREGQGFDRSIAGGTAVICTYRLDLVHTMLSYQADGEDEVYAQTTLQPLKLDSSQLRPCQELMVNDLHANGVRRNLSVLEYSHAPIAKGQMQFSPESEDETMLGIHGFHSPNVFRTFCKEYSHTADGEDEVYAQITLKPLKLDSCQLLMAKDDHAGVRKDMGGKDDDLCNSLMWPQLQESQHQQQTKCLQVRQRLSMQQQSMYMSKVQFFVRLDGRSISTQQILEEMTVRELIDYCCQQNGIRETEELYGVLCGKKLSDEELLSHYSICRNSTVDLRSRMRGGQAESYTARFSKPDGDLFYAVALSKPLRNPQIVDKDNKPAECVWKLKKHTRFWVRQVLVFFTGEHRAGRCYYGGFDKDDILFEDGRAYLRDGVDWSPFSGPGCESDYYKLSTIFGELKTADGYYAQYFDRLIDYLERCPFGEKSKSDPAIAFVINHAALEHFSDRMKQVMVIDCYLSRVLRNRKTPWAVKTAIRKALGNFFDWYSVLELCPAMKLVLDEGKYTEGGQDVYNPLYTENASGGFHYSNNYFKHARKRLGLEEIEAAHSVNTQNLLTSVLEDITKFAINPKNAGSVKLVKTLLDLIENDLANPQSEHSEDN